MKLRYFSVSEVAEMYSVSPDKVYRDIRRGFLPAVSVGTAVRVREPDAREYAKDVDRSAMLRRQALSR